MWAEASMSWLSKLSTKNSVKVARKGNFLRLELSGALQIAHIEWQSCNPRGQCFGLGAHLGALQIANIERLQSCNQGRQCLSLEPNWNSPKRQIILASEWPSKGALFGLGAYWSSNCEPNLPAQRVNCLAVGKGRLCLSIPERGRPAGSCAAGTTPLRRPLAGGTLRSSECGQHQSCLLQGGTLSSELFLGDLAVANIPWTLAL